MSFSRSPVFKKMTTRKKSLAESLTLRISMPARYRSYAPSNADHNEADE